MKSGTLIAVIFSLLFNGPGAFAQDSIEVN
jgi:hypothetical protein